MTAINQDTLFKRSEGAVWIQPSGPGTKFIFLNCAGLEAFQRNEGDVTLRYCKDEGRAGRFKVIDSYQGQQGPVTTSIVLPLGKATNYALSLRCPFNTQVRYTTCNRQDDPTGWEKILHFKNARITQRSSQPLVARDQKEEGEVLLTANLSADDVLEVNRLLVQTMSVADTKDMLDVTVDPTDRCEGNCGAATTAGQYAYIVGKAATYPTAAKVWRTTTSGGTWTSTAAQPFAGSQDISSVVMNGSRVIVALGTTDAANPAKIAYSDDNGATWTVVTVGTVNGQYINRLIWLAKPYLWAVSSDGYIYFSSDSGLTWAAQDSAAVTVQPYNDIDFSDTSYGWAVGGSNAMAKTTNGGLSWTAVTGPAVGVALNTVDALDATTVFVGTANGKLYKTVDGGVTWSQIRFTGDQVGAVKDVEFSDTNFGFMLHDSAAPVSRVLRTIDGGLTWEVLTTPTNAGMNRLSVVSQNQAFAVGKISSGVPVTLNITG